MFASLVRSRRVQNTGSRSRPTAASLRVDSLETREMPAAITVDVGQVVRLVNPQVRGVNLAWWDSRLNTAQTQQMVQAAGLTMFRLPGGSSSDEFHFNAPPTYSGKGTAATMASFIASVGGIGLVTLDYGSGSPQEAAAFLAYLNAPAGSSAAIGHGEEWSDSLHTWKDVDWQTAGYWAGLRAAAPLARDDGLNFLRLNRPTPFGLHYFEVGNEVYGSWETDHHGQAGDTGKPHDPATYVAFAQQFATLAASIDSTVAIGVDSGSDGIHSYSNWVANVLRQGVAKGFIPNFISDHSYMQAPGQESDSYLLLHTVSDPTNQNSNNPLDWALRASGYRTVLKQVLGSAAGRVELLATEYNSVYSNPGKQTTSLVNGLFVADSIGRLLQTEYNGANFWDLRNGWDTSNNNSSSLYGWRKGGDYGLLGSGNGVPPSSGTYVPYPTYFAEQLLSKMLHNGDTVVRAVSNDSSLSVYSVLQQNGHLDLLVINKNRDNDLAGQFQLTGFQPNGQAQFWQYGKTEDTAQSQTSDGHSALASFSDTLVLNGSRFSYSFPAYSMTVLDLPPINPVAVATLSIGGFPSTTTAGQANSITVMAEDANGNIVPGYQGTVHLTSSDLQAALPADYTFTGGDNGVHTFTATLKTAGSQSLTATDTAMPDITGTQSGISITAAAADHFLVAAAVTTTVAGIPFDLTVTVQDLYNNTVPDYAGAVSFSSADPFGAALPAVYLFTGADNGSHTFVAGVTLYTAGTWDVTVSDNASGISGSDHVTVSAAPASQFRLVAPAIAVANTPFDVTALALDSYGNVDPNYQGTIAFSTTDSDPAVVLPASYGFTTSDAGVHTFSAGVTLITPGNQTITITDSDGFTGSATIIVTAPAPPPLPPAASRGDVGEQGGNAGLATGWLSAYPLPIALRRPADFLCDFL